jgi:hypothetical protein
MFSAVATRPVTRTAAPRLASADMAAITAAPGDMRKTLFVIYCRVS